MRALLATPKPCPAPAGPLSRLPRPVLEAIVEAAIAELDARDGDPDAEPETDEFESMRYGTGPGDSEDAEDEALGESFPRDLMNLPRSNLFRKDRRHAA